jgi:hypothetical protein
MKYRAINQDNFPDECIVGNWRDTAQEAFDDAIGLFESTCIDMMVVASDGSMVDVEEMNRRN